jgi:hypothetical protein
VHGTLLAFNGVVAPGPIFVPNDCDTQVASTGRNLLGVPEGCGGFTGPGDLVDVDPVVGALGDHGGPTETIPLLAGSPAIDAGGSSGPETDQRGSSAHRVRATTSGRSSSSREAGYGLPIAADPLSGLEADLEDQRRFVSERVPVYARLLELLAAALADESLRDRLRDAWFGRSFGGFYERPLLILASLRDDALAAGTGHPLWEAIGADRPRPAGLSPATLAHALERDGVWESLRARHVQTNETSRAVAWLWPAALLASAAPGRALDLFDIGASAGLNLVADLLEPIWERDDGATLDVAPLPEINSRTGFDLRPLNVLDPVDERWLRACVWPGETERLAQLDAAIRAFRGLAAAGAAPRLEVSAAGDLPRALSGNRRSAAIAFQTLVRDFLTEEERAAYEAGMLDWLSSSPRGLAIWVQLELEANAETEFPFGLTARVAAGDGPTEPIPLARSGPHPRRLRVDERAVASFREATSQSAS